MGHVSSYMGHVTSLLLFFKPPCLLPGGQAQWLWSQVTGCKSWLWREGGTQAVFRNLPGRQGEEAGHARERNSMHKSQTPPSPLFCVLVSHPKEHGRQEEEVSGLVHRA